MLNLCLFLTLVSIVGAQRVIAMEDNITDSTTQLSYETTDSSYIYSEASFIKPDGDSEESDSTAVQNLTVDARRYNDTLFVQLVLNWEAPKKGSPPKHYAIAVQSNSSLCPNHVLEYCEPMQVLDTLILGNETSIIIPSVKQKNYLKIKPECCYVIEVTVSPDNGKRRKEIAYVVPECVANKCSCDKRHLPPDAIVSRVIHEGNGRFNITWYLVSNNDTLSKETEITKFIIRFGPRVMKSNSNNAVHNYSNFIVSINNTVFYKNNYSAVVHVNYTSDEPYGVHIKTFNSRGCESRQPADYTGTIRGESYSNSVSVLLIVGIAVISLITAVSITYFILRHCRTEWVCQKLRHWRGFYTRVDSDMIPTSQRVIPELKRNIIYVEKEIEEAREEGTADSYEISYSQIKLGRRIGEGAFGEVRLATAEAIAGIFGYSTVAVKTLKDDGKNEEAEEFLDEIKMLKKAGKHPNIVTLLGCCTLKRPYCMVMEYVQCGNLLDYLRKLRDEYERQTGRLISATSVKNVIVPRYADVASQSSDSSDSYIQPPEPSNSTEPLPLRVNIVHKTEVRKKPMLEYVLDTNELLNFAIQIARGMSHLESKNITHRDLAARNVLINENKTLKISDFGLSRQGIYVNKRGGKVPWRWLSVEAIRDHIYTNKSDVWAYGIVLWEIGTLGGFPYPTVADKDLLQLLLDGHRLEKPENCSDDLYSMMLQCWAKLPDMRPSFANILEYLNSMMKHKPEHAYVDFNMLRPDYTFPPTEDDVKSRKNIQRLIKYIKRQCSYKAHRPVSYKIK